MQIDARIPLGYRAPELIDPDKVRQQHVQTQLQQQHAKLYEMEAKQKEADIQEQQAFKDALGRGAGMPDLMKASPKYAAQHQKTLADQRKADYDAKKAELDLTAVQMNVFGRIAGTVRDTPSLMRAGDQLLKMGLIPKEIHDHIAQSGFTPEVANVLQQHMQQALTVEQQVEQARKLVEDEYKAAGEKRTQATFEAELPGKQADAQGKQLELAAQTVGDPKSQAEYDAWRATLRPEVAAKIPPQFSTGAITIVRKMGMSAFQQSSLENTAASQAETARHNAVQERHSASSVGQGASSTSIRNEAQLRDDFRQDSKAFGSLSSAYGKVQQAATADSAAADIALIYGFMRILDPTSTVREGEFATAQNAGSIPDRVIAAYNKAVNGGRLAPEIRKGFVAEATKIYNQGLQDHQQTRKFYEDTARRSGLNPQNVMPDYSSTFRTEPDPNQPVTIRTANGKMATFPNAQAANEYKRQAGIK